MREGLSIHETAIVHPEARLGEGSKVGPFSIIGEHVSIGKNCEIHGHAILQGHTQLGDGVRIYPNAVVGLEPQHLGYKGEPTRVEIGDRTVVREGATIHRATEFGKKVTCIGADCLIMAYAHIAHDCLVEDEVIVTNGVQLAGHVVLEKGSILGGGTLIAQHCRVGRFAYLGGGSGIRKDVPPFMIGKGEEFRVMGVNQIGLQRRGFSSESIKALKQAYRLFYLRKLTTSRAIEEILEKFGSVDEIRVFVDFVRSSKVGLER